MSGQRDGDAKNIVLSGSLMGERSHLPDLDYKALQIASLKGIKTAKGPEGRYQALVAYLKQRSGGATSVDAAEVDRRVRTWFEDIINKMLTSPQEWDQDRVMNGKALFDFLAGTKVQEPPAPPAPGGQAPA